MNNTYPIRYFIAAVFLFAGVINGAMLYRPAPVHARPVPSWIKTDKLQGQVKNPPWPEKIVQTESYRPPVVASVTATPERVSLPWSCSTIRQAVAGMTDEQIERIARIYRLTKQQRVEARKCLKKEST